MSIYPNPVEEELHIRSILTIHHIEIYDLCGRMVKEEILNDRKKLSVENLVPGVYSVKIKTNRGESIRK